MVDRKQIYAAQVKKTLVPILKQQGIATIEEALAALRYGFCCDQPNDLLDIHNQIIKKVDNLVDRARNRQQKDIDWRWLMKTNRSDWGSQAYEQAGSIIEKQFGKSVSLNGFNRLTGQAIVRLSLSSQVNLKDQINLKLIPQLIDAIELIEPDFKSKRIIEDEKYKIISIFEQTLGESGVYQLWQVGGYYCLVRITYGMPRLVYKDPNLLNMLEYIQVNHNYN